MNSLARHTKANREFFARGCAPHMTEWTDWIDRGIVDGKIIDGKPWVDLNAFAVARNLQPPVARPTRLTGKDLVKRLRAV